MASKFQVLVVGVTAPDHPAVHPLLPIRYSLDPREALQILEDRTERIAAIVLDPLCTRPGFLKTLSIARSARPITPIYALENPLLGGDPLLPESEFARLTLQGTLRQDHLMEGLKGHLHAEVLKEDRFSPFSPSSIETSFHLETAMKEGFYPFWAKDLLAVKSTPFDLYLRTPTEKWIRFAEAGEGVPHDRLQGYLKHGLEHLFIKMDPMKRCLQYCDLLSKTLFQVEGASPILKSVDIMNQFQGLTEALRSEHPPSDFQDRLGELVYQVGKIQTQLESASPSLLEHLLSQAALYDHAVSVTWLSLWMAKELEISTQSAREQLCAAAFLQDLGLLDLPADLQVPMSLAALKAAHLSDDLKALYRKHPLLGRVRAESIPGIDPLTLQTIEQHHERRDGKGYPHGLNAGKIQGLAEIVGILSEWVCTLRERDLTPKELLHSAERHPIFEGYSLSVIQALERLFTSTHSGSPPLD